MTLQVLGAGLGRTGTQSLKLALERLLHGPCYHMVDVHGDESRTALWHDAVRGDLPDWDEVFTGFEATVDWPAAAFWREIREAFPDAVVLLSVRDDAEAWWSSADGTVFEVLRRDAPSTTWLEMWRDLAGLRFCPAWDDPEAAMAAYERHNEEVRAEVPADRLVEWRPGDGWGPLCQALGLPEPEEQFPHVNTTEEFRLRSRLNRRRSTAAPPASS